MEETSFPAGGAKWQESSHLAGDSLAYIDSLYEAYLADESAVPDEWRQYFRRLPSVSDRQSPEPSHAKVRSDFLRLARQGQAPKVAGATALDEIAIKQFHVFSLISAYRRNGHRYAQLDPLALQPPAAMKLSLVPEDHGLFDDDMDKVFELSEPILNQNKATLRDIIAMMQSIYCDKLAVEYMHITGTAERVWLQQRLESELPIEALGETMQMQILERLTAAEGLEKYLHNRYPGVKRFGLEGGETLIPVLNELLQHVGAEDYQETVISMAHRGRLNVLVNVLGKQPSELMQEFEGKVSSQGSGDVKYHQGFSTNVMTVGGEMHLHLGFNPSHLEIGGSVIEGSVRARQDRRGDDGTHEKVLPVVIHGDAAFAAQGVVAELFQMSQTRGYKTGGTVHIVVNNQIGFTTHHPEDARSSEYCTSLARIVQAPVIHVNADEPETAVWAMLLAADYRMVFKKDVVLDLVCYRRRGHNEAEDPSKTQPLMYQAVANKPTTREIYARKLERQGLLEAGVAQEMADEYRDLVDAGRKVALALVSEPDTAAFVDWSPYYGQQWTAEAKTAVDKATFSAVAAQLQQLPQDFKLHNQIKKVMQDRQAMAAGDLPINWGFAEIMAYATLVHEGFSIRMTGQDCGVGTFSHRHACLYDQNTGDRFTPVADSVAEKAEMFAIYDSLLSEEAVLGFEYGYATTNPDVLTIWEAQFGDFANGAQVVIDQFISSGEEKWDRLCGLVMLLPHGFEGAGPEHSSARLERYLQLCAEHNIQVCVPTTPAQIFHLLRRQMIRPLRKPLIVMTPKSLLRHKLAVSSLADCCEGQFQSVIDDVDCQTPERVKRLVLCSGKVYYDLLQERRKAYADDVAIIRIEQLYPFPDEVLAQMLAPYNKIQDVIWCQEEPLNQGAWYPSQHHMRRVIAQHQNSNSLYLVYSGRASSAAPATGYMAVHQKQQKALVENALFGR